MNICLAVCPSFDEGFALEIDQRGIQAVPEGGTADTAEYIIKTKALGRDAFVRVAQLESLFSPVRTSQPIHRDDAAPLMDLVLGIRVSPTRAAWATCDGTPTALSIERGDMLIALEWNSGSPSPWPGVDELVAYLGRLFLLYRHLRDPEITKG